MLVAVPRLTVGTINDDRERTIDVNAYFAA
jgi:hypothetical protein